MCNRWRDERGSITVWAAVLLPLFFFAAAVTLDFQRARLHREELVRAADAAALGVQPAAWITERRDAKGRVYDKRVWLDQTEARSTALDLFWANLPGTRLQKFASAPPAADAWVDPLAPDTVTVTANASTGMPYAGLFGKKTQTIETTVKAQVVLR